LKLEVLKKEKNISILTLSIIIAVFLILFIVIIWRSRINYKNKVLALEKENNVDLANKLEVEKENSELKQRLIEQQKSELLGYSMEVSNMNEKIENLITKFEESDISSTLSGQLKSLITVNKSWDSFIERFKEVDPEFIPRLSKKYPNLTQKDLEFCSLVRINISYKDIGNFLQISHESVFKKKYRISKKMELDQEVDFQSYIIQF
jgi:DNA-binding CsgD family transcriptional regulator